MYVLGFFWFCFVFGFVFFLVITLLLFKLKNKAWSKLQVDFEEKQISKTGRIS